MTTSQLFKSQRPKYGYDYVELGKNARIVRFNLDESTFYINENHPLVQEYYEDKRARSLLEDFLTAEALLEVYLRYNGVSAEVIGEVLERRNLLLQALAKDRVYSLKAVANSLRDAVADNVELEIATVVAARGLGFVAKHIAGPGEPDGVARFLDYNSGKTITITLEAKSSRHVPALPQLDFAGLKEHMDKYKAEGCLLVAPRYPASDNAEGGVANRANTNGISCWTVEQLATVIEAVGSFQITTLQFIDLIKTRFSPQDVADGIQDLLDTQKWNMPKLYGAILEQLEVIEHKAVEQPRTVEMILGRLLGVEGYGEITKSILIRAITEMAAATNGGLSLSGETLYFHVSLEEVKRRLEHVTVANSDSRKASSFRIS